MCGHEEKAAKTSAPTSQWKRLALRAGTNSVADLDSFFVFWPKTRRVPPPHRPRRCTRRVDDQLDGTCQRTIDFDSEWLGMHLPLVLGMNSWDATVHTHGRWWPVKGRLVGAPKQYVGHADADSAQAGWCLAAGMVRSAATASLQEALIITVECVGRHAYEHEHGHEQGEREHPPRTREHARLQF